jgi:hypothetical protein
MAAPNLGDFQRRRSEMEKAIAELESGVREDASTLVGLASGVSDEELLALSEEVSASVDDRERASSPSDAAWRQDAKRAILTLEQAPEAMEREIRRQRLLNLKREITADQIPSEPKTEDKSLNDAEDLFAKYDKDNSGAIDKSEFKDLERDIRADTDRRKVLQLASAVVGSLVVADKSSEFLWAQKTFRPLYAEKKAEAAQAKIFPTALLSGDVDAAVAKTLAKRGFTASNTLYGYSVCSDEVNFKDQQLVSLMTSRWGEGFSLGGLGGLPFAGKSGFRAYLHHVPDKGKLLVMFAPHVGIDDEGRIGALQREGQSAVSKACGAAIGAFKAIAAQKAAANNGTGKAEAPADADQFDPELQQIIGLLEPKLDGIEGSANDIGFVTYQVYGIVRDLIDACIAQTPDVWKWTDEVALVGGIMINRKTGGDFFQPLSFETRSKDAPPVDLFDQTFGTRPDLVPVLGYSNAKIATQVYGEDTLARLSTTARRYLDELPNRL